MVTKIQKWGNSLALRIPRALAEDASLTEGKPVNVQVVDGRLVLSAIKPVRYNLDDMLKRVTSKNIHREISTGDAMGKEVW